MNDGLADACQAVLEAPTVDAVEVVRCAECKRFDPLYGEVGICLLHTAQAHGNVTMQPDDFCSYGERKDGEG